MDPEDFSISSDNSTDEIYEEYTDDEYDDEEIIYDRLFLELVTLVGLISVVTNLLIVFVIVKPKILRKDVTYMLVVHLNIFEAIYFFFSPLTLRVAMLIDITTRVNMTVICAANDMEYAVNFAICVFVSLLIFDWYTKLYHEDIYKKFCRVSKYIVIFVYVSTIGLCIATVQLSCQSDTYFDTFLAIISVNFVLLLFVVIMNIIHAAKKRKFRLSKNNNVGLVITNLACLLSCPSLLTNILYFFGIRSNIGVAFTVSITLGFAHPVFSFFYFFCYDNRFNISLKKLIRCKCNDNENEDLENLSVSYNDVHGVQIR